MGRSQTHKLKLVNAQEVHNKRGYSFYTPSSNELDSLQEGNSVKICTDTECFWAILTNVDGEQLTGRVEHNLYSVDIDPNDTISFEKKHVYDYSY